MKNTRYLLVSVLIFPFFFSCQNLKTNKRSTDKRKILVSQNSSLPRQLIMISFPIGAGDIDKKKQGVTNIYSEIFDKGPSTLNDRSYKKRLFDLNASISLNSGAETTSLSVKAPPDKIEEALQLAFEIFEKPKIESEFEVAKAKVANNRKVMNESMQSVILYYARRDMYDYHPRTLDGTGSLQSIDAVSIEDLRSFETRLTSFKPFLVVSSGPMGEDDVKTLTRKRIGSPENFSSFKMTPLLEPKREGQSTITIINKPDVTDNQVLYIKPQDISEDTYAYMAGELAFYLLGGSGGALYDELRAKKGLTYGAFAGQNGLMKRSVVYTFASNDNIAELLSEVLPTIEIFKTSDITSRAIKESKAKLISTYRQSLELPKDELFEEVRIRLYDLDSTFVKNYEANIQSVTKPQIKKFSQKHMTFNRASLYLMGDAKILSAAAKKVKLDGKIRVVELDEIW